MAILTQDLRYAFRALGKSPGFTAVAVMALALGIGANTAIFSVIDALLLRPLSFEDLDHLVTIWEAVPKSGDRAEVSSADWADWRDQGDVFEQMAAYRSGDVNLTGAAEPERISGCLVSTNFFRTLGVRIALGRDFLPEEGQAGRDLTVILGHNLWRRGFDGNPGIIGGAVELDGRKYTVVGVLPPGLEWPIGAELWTPLAITDEERSRRQERSLFVLGRVKPQLSVSQAQAEMDVIARRLQQQYPRTNAGWGVKLVRLPGQDPDSAEIIRSFLIVLMGAAGFVLLIACANVANLQLARAIGRQKEIALRLALGATRWRVVRQLLTESVLLSFLGAVVGALLAGWGVNLIKANTPPDQVKYIPGFSQMHLNAHGLEFTLVMALLTGILSGLAPAARTSKPDLEKALKEGGRRSTGGARSLRLRGLLVVCEVALALILLVGTGLMVKGFVHLFNNPQKNFDPRNTLTMRIALSKLKYRTPHQRAAFYEQMLDRLGNLPKIESVGAVSYLPLSGDWNTESFIIEGRATSAPSEARLADLEFVSTGYLRSMRIPLLEGREFTSQDGEMTIPVVMISQSMARRFWPGENPLGRRIKLGPPGSENLWLTIVGIVGDVKQLVLDRDPRLTIYIPYLQSAPSVMSLVIRDSVDPMSLVPSVRAEVLNVSKEQPIYSIRSMEQVIDDSVAGVGMAAALMGSFGVVALILSAVGIYSVVAYSVSQRTHEIGVRMALGAQHPDILRLIVSQALKLGVIGLAAGLPGAFVLGRIMSNMLFGLTSVDTSTFVGFALLLLATSLLSGYVPALRATKVTPLEALRRE